MVDLGSGSGRNIKDYKLSRYACYLIAQNGDKIRREEIKGQGKANVAHFVVGKKVRETIHDIGGILPENLPPHSHQKTKARPTKVD